MNLTSLITPLITFLLLTHFPNHVTSSNCSVSTCRNSDHPVIRFPFRLRDSELPVTCGLPGFDVSCGMKSKQTFLELSISETNFTVKNIDYAAQEIWVNDPNNCLPQKLLNLNLSNSPFSEIYHQYFNFLNCSTIIQNHNKSRIVGPINCLSASNYFVYATPSNGSISTPMTCYVMAPMVKVPVQWPPSLNDDVTFLASSELNEDLRLSWFMPECQICELNGQMCGLETNSSGSQVTVCSNIPSNNDEKSEKLPSTTVIAVILIICSPSIICIAVSFSIWIRTCYTQRSNPTPPPGPIAMQTTGHLMELGLEEFNVEFARQMVLLGLRTETGPEVEPTIVLSEIDETGLSPKGDGENSCAICMGEYQAKDKIGTLPTCSHFFHVECINKWLLQSPRIIGRTCPICRARVE